MQRVLWWIRRDLRLSDNPALQAALSTAAEVLPLFVVDPNLISSPAPNRRGFLFAGLRQLDADLQARGSRLFVRSGDPLEVMRAVLAETGAEAIFAQADGTPYALERDRRISTELPLRWFDGVGILPPDAVLKADGSAYTIYTHYRKAWMEYALPDWEPASRPLPAPERLPFVLPLDGDPVPAGILFPDFPPGESEALRRLEAFCERGIKSYALKRDRLDLDGTSRLSPYLHFGMLSPRQALAAAVEARQAFLTAGEAESVKGVEAWIGELVWREFYQAILYHFPKVRKQAFRPNLREIEWRHAPEGLAAWQEGRTGFPVVDAGMRQLRATGWMHNRARMIVASFLVKDLLIDWREGERWFLECLLDGDLAANNGGWQWTAGVGTDAAPYFRIFNPVLQGAKFDPHGDYVRRWVPELTNVPAKYIHHPWDLPEPERRTLNYPDPIVDRTLARQRVMRAYGKKAGDGESSART
jgi:deoxyribodipyrimidine photo-lyase